MCDGLRSNELSGHWHMPSLLHVPTPLHNMVDMIPSDDVILRAKHVVVIASAAALAPRWCTHTDAPRRRAARRQEQELALIESVDNASDKDRKY